MSNEDEMAEHYVAAEAYETWWMEDAMSDEYKILGISKRSYPSEYTGYQNVSVVLCEGDIGDYAAYAGQGDPQWIAAHGDKITFEEACCHFPGGQLQREKYRQ